MYLLGFCPTVAANILSIGGCLWLLWRLQKLSPAIRHRLFPRQVRYLAWADLLFHCSSILLDLLDYGVLGSQGTTCARLMPLVEFASICSLLVSLHLAVSFLVQILGMRCAERVLPMTLPMVWPVGFVVSCLEVVLYPAEDDSHSNWCTQKDGRVDYVFVGLLFGCFVLSCASYVATIVQAHICPESVARHCWWRAGSYLLSFILTQSLIVVVCFTKRDNRDILQILAVTLQNLTGFANMLTYALQSRYAAKLLRHAPGLAKRETDADADVRDISYQVRIGGVTVAEYLTMHGIDSTHSSLNSSVGSLRHLSCEDATLP